MLDRYFGNVCELDLFVPLSRSSALYTQPDTPHQPLSSIFNFQKAYAVRFHPSHLFLSSATT